MPTVWQRCWKLGGGAKRPWKWRGLPGIDHRLLDASAGAIDQYSQLLDRRVSRRGHRGADGMDGPDRPGPPVVCPVNVRCTQLRYVDPALERRIAPRRTAAAARHREDGSDGARAAKFIIDAPLVSRLHCHLAASPAELVVEDLGSTNGTFVNERRVQKAALQDGDHLRLGDVVLSVARE